MRSRGSALVIGGVIVGVLFLLVLAGGVAKKAKENRADRLAELLNATNGSFGGASGDFGDSGSGSGSGGYGSGISGIGGAGGVQTLLSESQLRDGCNKRDYDIWGGDASDVASISLETYRDTTVCRVKMKRFDRSNGAGESYYEDTFYYQSFSPGWELGWRVKTTLETGGETTESEHRFIGSHFYLLDFSCAPSGASSDPFVQQCQFLEGAATSEDKLTREFAPYPCDGAHCMPPTYEEILAQAKSLAG